MVAVRQASVLFVLGLSVFHLGEQPGALRVAGALLTVLGVGLYGVCLALILPLAVFLDGRERLAPA